MKVSARNKLEGTISAVNAGPISTEIVLDLAGGDKLVAVAPPEAMIKPGDTVSIDIRLEGVHLFDAETGKRIEPAAQRI